MADKYTLTVTFKYEDGRDAAPTITGQYDAGATIFVIAPGISGYTSNVKQVRGTMPDSDLTIPVVYYQGEAISKIKPWDNLLPYKFSDPTKASIETPTINNAILTGVPVAPTPPDSSNSNRIATTEFVKNVAGDIPIITVDSALSNSSTNPVQNAIVTQAITGLSDDVDDLETAIGDIPIITVDSALSNSSTNPVQNAVLASALSNIEAALYQIEQKLAILYDNDKNGTGTWAEHESRGTTYAFNCYKRGKLGVIYLDFNKTATATGSSFVEIGQLPEGYYPSRQFYMQVPIQSQSASVTVSIQTDGTLAFYANHTTSGRVRCTMAYNLRQADY